MKEFLQLFVLHRSLGSCFCGMLLHLEYKKEGCQYVSRKLDQVLEIWVGWKVGVPKS